MQLLTELSLWVLFACVAYMVCSDNPMFVYLMGAIQ